MRTERIKTDVLIIGGGTAGCFAAYVIGQKSNRKVLIAEKANIKRSGCLAAGVNALNAYITEGRVPQDYVDYAKKDAHGIVREDLLLSMSERLNHVTKVMEDLGLVILKDENGKYVARGNRNIKINGENMKPILAKAAAEQENVTVLNHVNITDYKTENGKITGAVGFGVNEDIFYDIDAEAVLCATGGAAGLYRPNNPGFSRHKMWYPPFNTGAGYAMGLLSGAEMTTFEMRFIALRCKDTIAPTGTIAQGVGARQVNAHDDIYETKYGLTTSQRVYGTVMENREGNGPCYLRTEGISKEQEQDLYKAYLNMAPSQTLKWMEAGKGPSEENVEIEGTEPYIVGGHTASGYWVDNNRATTIEGLYAAGDVAGGCPQKYVTGALAEGEIAAEAILEYLGNKDAETRGKGATEKQRDASGQAEEKTVTKITKDIEIAEDQKLSEIAEAKKAEYESHLNSPRSLMNAEQLEEAMQKIMDQYAGGIGTDYRYSETSLAKADEKIAALLPVVDTLAATDTYELMQIYELRERLIVCRAVIAHLAARKETRWHSFGENTDYPDQSEDWMKYVNSRMENGEIKILYRDLVTKENADKQETANTAEKGAGER
ncbi:adenylyl-sulfate reductase subunit alpha [Ruminococcus sp. TM10-9AT]|jgi:adenylylsulfate reductase subunit A|nr:adenylyl-sulfate reductase subunit alpha [Ruminococcus sp. TM10-9AT]RGW17038.1 adenylyl-sulfate reductase subunit alpha [Ruminococcus sp. AF13-37]RGW19079.1 adenylyl-sulfate reductase subunit alpha [Ruminococcus sp. AF13-28]